MPIATKDRIPRRVTTLLPSAIPFLFTLVVALVVALAVAVSCGKDSPTRSSGPSKIVVVPAGATLDALGATVRLVSNVLDEHGEVIPNAVTVWSNSDPMVASVDDSGLVTALRNGETKIRATSGQKQATVTVIVTQSPDRIVITPERADLSKIFNTLQLNAVVYDANDHPLESAAPVWSSGDSSVVAVSGDGLMTARGNGETTVTAAFGPVSASIPVKVEGFDTDLDRDALIALYQAAKGPEWTINDNWASPSPLGEWYGVNTDDDGRVTEIVLDANGLVGRLPAELGQLGMLQTLSLAGNRLMGEIPPEIGNLANLRILVASENEFDTAPIPLELTGLKKLEVLVLASSGLCVPSDPEAQDWLFAIEAVFVDFCDQVPGPGGDTTVSPRSVLFALYHGAGGPEWTRQANWLSTAPLDDWAGVTADSAGGLTSVDLSDNNLSGALTASLGYLEHLSSLKLSDNAELAGPLPVNLVNLELQLLHLDGTGLCAPPFGDFPAWLESIPDRRVSTCAEAVSLDRVALTALYGETGGSSWSENEHWLTDAPLGSWHGITTDDEDRVIAIDLPANNLAGRMPQELELLERLTRLNLSGNHVAGVLPEGLGLLSRLTELDLSHNMLNGSIPGSLGELNRLQTLRLAFNQLTGEVDQELGQLGQLVELDLSTNNLDGPIPAGLARLSNLAELNLSTNLFTEIPAELGQLDNLVSLSLAFNALTGPIPAELGNLGKLEHLLLFANQLEGPIPPELGKLRRLTTLNLDANLLTGPIPTDLGQLGTLRELHLDDNDLEGSIPSELGQLKGLSTLSLAGNQLAGSIPDALGEIAALRTLSLSGNQALSGPLPPSLTQLNLQSLLLANTKLCAPKDPEFRMWLSGIAEIQVADCKSDTTPASTAYLIQGVQRLDRPVPLIAGEAALLRVFVVENPAAGGGRPPVRATFYQNDREVHSVEIPGSEHGMADMADMPAEGDLALSANAAIPAEVIQPGLEMLVEIDPAVSAGAGRESVRRIPAQGRLPVDVVNVPPLDLTLVPFLWIENPDRTMAELSSGLTAEDDLFSMTRDVLPVGEFELRVREPVWTSVSPDPFQAVSILGEVLVVHAMDGAAGHYMGVLNGEAGIALWPGRVSVSSLNKVIIAHELGHNMFLRHADCGGPAGVDPDYPHDEGRTGTWGYDLLSGALVEPSNYDLMSYCMPNWISAYHFKKALIYRLSEAPPPMMAGAAAENGSLLVWGGISTTDGLFLNPAFVVDATPSLPRSRGPYRLEGEDSGGNALFGLSMDLPVLADGAGSAFAVILPMRADWRGNLHRIVLTGPGGAATIDGTYESASAILLDRTTGDLRGVLCDWPADAGAASQAARRLLPEPGLRVQISHGMPGLDPR